MVPESVPLIDRIPMNVNGKTDHDALLRHWRASAEPAREIVAPSHPIEAQLVEVFARILGVPEVSITDNFIELGGHSLLAFRLIEACTQALGAAPEVADLLTRSIQELAVLLQSTSDAASGLLPLFPGPDLPVLVFIHAASGAAAAAGLLGVCTARSGHRERLDRRAGRMVPLVSRTDPGPGRADTGRLVDGRLYRDGDGPGMGPAGCRGRSGADA
jgi:hypothetical protein